MGGETLPVGPFSGGLNISQHPRMIAESELSSCTNFNIDTNGELIIRRGLRYVDGPVLDVGTSEILAVTRLAGGQDRAWVQGRAGGVYRVFSTNNIHTPTWTEQITYTGTNKAGDAVQYKDKLWLPSAESTGGYEYNLISTATLTVPAMPAGTKSFIYKDRMFLFKQGTYRVYYSNALDLTQWGGASFFDINPGDGEPILSAIVSGESVIFFKENSTWILYYDSDPGLGTLRKLNSDVGITGEKSVIVIANDIYILSHRGVYRLTNSFYEDISKKIDLFDVRSSNAADIKLDSMSSLGDRFIVSVQTPTGKRHFVYQIENNVWTEYAFPDPITAFMRFQDSDNAEHYITIAADLTKIFVYSPYGTDEATENPTAGFTTKEYDYGDAAGWKRLFWLSFEVSANAEFLISMTVDGDTTAPTVHPPPVGADFRIIKSYLPRRFRTISYSLSTVPVARSIFSITSGSVSVAAKKRVVQRETT